ncbi:MAG: AlpA family phage regulatory protein [Xanthomonadales bacterium]|nr:AlpA family phage regulatory protein [Anaerolineae bacterium]MCB1609667.1 AlpA family phage regulatory protein [Xanthomonadales bacterium]
MRNRLLRSAVMDQRTPYKRERRRELEKLGLHPPRIMLSARCAVWLEQEVDRWQAALAAGCNESEVRELVGRMVAEREQGKTSA